MIKSEDGFLEIVCGSTPADVIYPPASWSTVNIPVDHKEASDLFMRLYHTATSKHLVLALCRHKRGHRVKAVSNLPGFLTGWNYLETVSIFYERPSTCSNNGFLPIAESAWLFYKGDTPDANNTEWFVAGDYKNATNLWNVAPQEKEDSSYSYYQKFNWETQMLLMSLAQPLGQKRFIYTPHIDKVEQFSLFKFCHKFGLTACLYTDSFEESQEILDNYKKFLEKK